MPIEIYGTKVPTYDEFTALWVQCYNDHTLLWKLYDEMQWWRANFNSRCWSVAESYAIQNIFPRIDQLAEAYLYLVDRINSIALDLYRIEQMVVELAGILGLLPEQVEALSKRLTQVVDDLTLLDRYASLILSAWGVGKRTIVEEIISKMERETGISLDSWLPSWIAEAIQEAEEVTR